MLAKLLYIKINGRNTSVKDVFNSSDSNPAYSILNASKTLLDQRKELMLQRTHGGSERKI